MKLLAIVKGPTSIARYLAVVSKPTAPLAGPRPAYWRSRVLRRQVLGEKGDAGATTAGETKRRCRGGVDACLPVTWASGLGRGCAGPGRWSSRRAPRGGGQFREVSEGPLPGVIPVSRSTIGSSRLRAWSALERRRSRRRFVGPRGCEACRPQVHLMWPSAPGCWSWRVRRWLQLTRAPSQKPGVRRTSLEV
jgi:hypothetical protein